ncbi:MAG: response regulator transcription factor [Oligoflexia bacterium]|nr:response regulator transcription factor [Oligoflexia bacterium]MBF0365875.1 response regulator transcription factor [Oligoflexia bacterium]
MKSGEHILVLEDDPEYLFIYKDIFDSKYQMTYLTTIAEFEQFFQKKDSQYPQAAATKIDLAIVDLKLPDGHFLNHLSISNNLALDVPFVVISSDYEISSLRYCLDEGALDYFVKPFKRSELIVKIERILSKNKESSSKLQNNIPDPNPPLTTQLQPSIPSDLLSHLTKKEYEIMMLFLKSPNYTLHRKHLVEIIWKNVSVYPKTLDVHLYNLRKKILSFGFVITYSKETTQWTLSKI